jgi:hypothetical protein
LLDLLQAHLATSRDPLIYRLKVHRTGEPVPSFEPTDVVLFWLGDPLEALYPRCYASALEIERRARAAGARVLNPPEALNRTSKVKQSIIWRRAGIPCAGAWGFQTYDELLDALPRLPRPLIVRHDWGHSQRGGMFVAWTEREVRKQALNVQFPVAALEFLDVRAEFETKNGSSVYERFHHKKRAFVFCDSVVNSHVFFSSSPLVCLSTSTFMRQARWSGRLARRLGLGRELLRDTIDADKAFFEGPPDSPETLQAAMMALGLDVAAIDYASRPDGGVIVWEANPYFSLPHGSRSVLPEERNAVPRVEQTVAALASALTRALAVQTTAAATRSA